MLHSFVIPSRQFLRGISRIKYTTLMRTNRRAFIFFSVFCALIFSGLLFEASRAVPAAPRKDAPTGKKVPDKNIPESISGVTTGISATLPDPKRPGKLLYELRAAAGNGQADASGFHGGLTSIWARLYQNGAPSAILTAPHARGGSVGKSVTITGTGGVVVKSLIEPGTKMTADTVVWYANLNKIVGTGHVFYRSGKTGAVLTGSRVDADTRLKTVNISGGGHGTAVF